MFAAWGAVLGAAVAFGPLLGGFLTTNYSWRWAFRINVVVAPLADTRRAAVRAPHSPIDYRERIDVPGALLIASGMFMLVFGISEGATYGWWSVEGAARHRGRNDLVGLDAGVDRAVRVPARGVPALRVLPSAAVQGACGPPAVV